MSDDINTPIGNTVKESENPRRYRIVHRGRKVEVFVDDTLIASTDKAGTAGSLGVRNLVLYVHRESSLRIFDFAVRDLGDAAK